MRGSDYVLLSYLSIRPDVFVGPDRMSSGGCLDVLISVHLDLILLRSFVLFSCLDFIRRGCDYILSSYTFTCFDVSLSPDGMSFGVIWTYLSLSF